MWKIGAFRIFDFLHPLISSLPLAPSRRSPAWTASKPSGSVRITTDVPRPIGGVH